MCWEFQRLNRDPILTQNKTLCVQLLSWIENILQQQWSSVVSFPHSDSQTLKDQSGFVTDLLIAPSEWFFKGCACSPCLETEINPLLTSTIMSSEELMIHLRRRFKRVPPLASTFSRKWSIYFLHLHELCRCAAEFTRTVCHTIHVNDFYICCSQIKLTNKCMCGQPTEIWLSGGKCSNVAGHRCFPIIFLYFHSNNPVAALNTACHTHQPWKETIG